MMFTLIDMLSVYPTLLFIFLVLIFFVGASVGSFMEVVRVRGSWRKATSGRSVCEQCQCSLRVRDLVPCVSYVMLRCMCARCGEHIPPHHFLSEVLMGSLFVLVFFFAPSVVVLCMGIVASIFLVPIGLQDIENYEVPLHLSIPFIGIAGLYTLGVVVLQSDVSPLLYGLLLATPFFCFWLFSRGRAMGLGDAVVALPIGFFLDSVREVIIVFFATFWFGCIFLLLYWVYTRGIQKRHIPLRGAHVPLIPSMVVAYFSAFFLGDVYCVVLPGLCAVL